MNPAFKNYAAMFAALAFVSNCSTTTTNLGSSANQVVAATRDLCGFVPTLTSVAAILNLPGAPAADKIVQEICSVIRERTKAGFVEPGKQVAVTVFGKTVQGELK
ncbi:hypothetical protein GOL96_30105 [Sinorhizobium medicae]|nr:hypothetical protein [Sinorhizobium medicae]MDX1237979.1 hypothetical protein [Sinorhizobium medicae]